MPNSSQFPDIGQNSYFWITVNFRISGQFLKNENFHNSRTSNNIDMKLGPELNLTREKRQRQKV